MQTLCRGARQVDVRLYMRLRASAKCPAMSPVGWSSFFAKRARAINTDMEALPPLHCRQKYCMGAEQSKDDVIS